jgi:hypothetical protein
VKTSVGIYGFAAIEMPEARFREHLVIPLTADTQSIPICPDYLGAIEPETLRIISIIGGQAILHPPSSILVFPSPSLPRSKSPSLHVTLSAIRRGFRQPRFPEYTRQQMERNLEFYQSAHR